MSKRKSKKKSAERSRRRHSPRANGLETSLDSTTGDPAPGGSQSRKVMLPTDRKDSPLRTVVAGVLVLAVVASIALAIVRGRPTKSRGGVDDESETLASDGGADVPPGVFRSAAPEVATPQGTAAAAKIKTRTLNGKKLNETPTSTGVPTKPALVSSVVTRRLRRRAERESELLDPRRDGWDSEHFVGLAQTQLNVLAAKLEAPESLDESAAEQLITKDFHCDLLRPESLVFSRPDSRLHVWRMKTSPRRLSADQVTLPLVAHAGLKAAILSLHDRGAEDDAANFSPLHVSLKIDGTDWRADGSVETSVIFEAVPDRSRAAARPPRTSDDASADDVRQITARWRCLWQVALGEEPPVLKLKTVSVESYEEVVLTQANRLPWFVDVSQMVLGNTQAYQDELQLGMDDWVNRLERRLMISRFGHHGLAVGDVNGDGRDDVYLCQPGGLSNRLMIQDDDGTVRDESAASRTDYLDATTSALLIDLDNDGDQDLVLATIHALAILSNDGTGRFTARAAFPECDRAFSLAAADFDLDGRVDVYACRYRPDAEFDFELPLPVPYQDANNGGSNFLFRNLGDWVFEDVTKEAGLDADNTRFSFAAAWEDFDNDGDSDLYVANDYGRNCLYRNHRGRFENIADQLHVEDIASGMSVSWSDFNHDGVMDLYVSNMFSKAGNRISRQAQFAANHDPATLAQLQRHARGNTLFAGRAITPAEPETDVPTEVSYQDVSLQQGVNMGRWAWGSLFADINNDTWDDLLIVNGLMTTEDTGDL